MRPRPPRHGPRLPSIPHLLARAERLLPPGLVRFLLVGVIGLTTNLGLLWLLERAGLRLAAALGLSLAAATLVTWALNRRHTFARSGRPAHQEALRYAAVAGVAQGVSYLVTLTLADLLPRAPHTADAFAGAVMATLFSYSGQRFFTFAPEAGAEAAAPSPAAD